MSQIEGVAIFFTNGKSDLPLDNIAKALKILGSDIPEGRTFLNNGRAFCVAEDSKIELVRWQWLSEDLVNEIVKIIFRL